MRRTIALLIGSAITLLAGSALAVGTSHWVHTTESDFKSGTAERVVPTNLGDLKLSRAVKSYLEQDPKISWVYSIVEGPDKTLYAGTGPEGIVLQIKDDKVSTLTTLGHNTFIFSLLVDRDGRLLIGAGGEKGQVFRLDKGEKQPKPIYSAKGMKYVWGMIETPDRKLYVATGDQGQLIEIDGDKSRVLFDCDESNLKSIVSDGKNNLYLGTDPHGIVYRIDRTTGNAFVLFNAGEAEISALALDRAGNLYAATAESNDQSNGGADNNETDQVGRPEGGTGGVPLPSHPPDNPKPPEIPKPNPGEPEPIPKNPSASIRPILLVTAGKLDDEPDEPAPGPAPQPTPPPGHPKPGPAPVKTPDTTAPPQPRNGAPHPPGEGNAIYRIDPEGFVKEVFRQPAMVFSLVEKDGILLVGTGSEGLIYQVNPAAEETVVLAKVDAKQVLCLAPVSDGRIFMGLANTGGIAAMSSGYASDGTYVSPVLDAQQISRFGKIQLHGSLPTGTTLKLATRSGNVKDPGEKGWSDWSKDLPAEQFMPVLAPSARFLQYRLTFTSSEGKQTPIVEDIDVAYQMPNLAPVIKAIKIADKPQPGADEGDPQHPSKPKPTRIQTIAWDAADPNSDSMLFSLYIRSSSQSPWVLIKDKLKTNTFDWDTSAVADGRYEVKVVASDASANPAGAGKTTARVSDPVLVDNTAPVIGDLKWKVTDGALKIDLRVVDTGSTVSSVDYTIDSNDDWQAVLPSDNIFDSPDETVSFTTRKLPPGTHQVTLRATDVRGNQSFGSIVVKIEP